MSDVQDLPEVFLEKRSFTPDGHLMESKSLKVTAENSEAAKELADYHWKKLKEE